MGQGFTTKGTGQGKVPQRQKDYSKALLKDNPVDDKAAARTSKLAKNEGTSKAKPKATIKSIRKDTRGKKRDARRATRDDNRDRRRDLRDKNRNEKDPTKRMDNKVKAQKDNEQARKDMRAQKKSIRKKAKG